MNPQEQELGKGILKYLLDHDRSGESQLPEAKQIAKHLGAEVLDVIDQLDILVAKGAVELAYGMGSRESMGAWIKPIGKAMLQMIEENDSETKTRLMSPDPTGEAIGLLEQLCLDLEATTFQPSHLVGCLRRYLRILRILGWDYHWVVKELDGYSDADELPPWRGVMDHVIYVSKREGTVLKSELKSFRVPAAVSVLVSNQKSGFQYATGRTGDVSAYTGRTSAREAHGVSSLSIKTILDHLSDRLFDEACKALVTLKFGQVTASVFREYQTSVDGMLVHLGIEDYLKTAYQDLLRNDEASWQNAANACRNIIHKLSDILWSAPGEYHPYLKDKDGAGLMKITPDKPKNRLRAYLHEKGKLSDELVRSQLDVLTNMIDGLYSVGSKGKQRMSYEEVRRLLIYTYIFLGDLIHLTDMKPVTEVRKV